MVLCDKAQEIYNTSAIMQIVPFGQLYGDKIGAALKRQHPRDLFDVKLLIENEGFSKDIKEGFLLSLISSKGQIIEMIAPNFHNQQQAMDNQFIGMSEIEFTYSEFEETRRQLVKTIKNNLTKSDKEFLLSFKNCTPDWSIYDFERFPAVQQKLQHLQKLKTNNIDKYKKIYRDLEKIL